MDDGCQPFRPREPRLSTSINNLALLTGNVGKAGASPFSITGQCNAMGTRESRASLRRCRATGTVRQRVRPHPSWPGSGDVDAPTDLPRESAAIAYPDIVEACVKGEIKALWIIATNPLVSFPNVAVLRQGFENLDFPGGAGRLPPHTDHGNCRPSPPGSDLGREDRHLYQLRAPCQQGEQGSRAARRGSVRLRDLPGDCGANSVSVRGSIPDWTGP